MNNINVSPFCESARVIQNELAQVGIYVNCNAIPFDSRPPYHPSGIRIGTPALTTRGLKENDCRLVAQLIIKFIKNLGNKNIKKEIKNTVRKISSRFPIYKDFQW